MYIYLLTKMRFGSKISNVSTYIKMRPTTQNLAGEPWRRFDEYSDSV